MRSTAPNRLPLTAALALATILPVLLPATGAAQSVDEVIDMYVEARGGLARLRAIETLVYSGGVYHEGDYTGSGDAFMAFERPYLRVVGNPERPGGFMEGYDGSSWEWFADPGVVLRTVGAASGAARRGADFEGSMVDYRSKGSTASLGPAEEIGGRPAYRVRLTTRDGFARDYFIDRETHLVVAERRTAPIHAFGEEVTSETRVDDYRPVAGVLFAHHYAETEIATGRLLSEMRWGAVEANRELPAAWFSPPVFERSLLQRFVEQLYAERTDAAAVMWSYAEFRRHHPEVETDDAVSFVGYQILKMGEVAQAVELLEANAADHPRSAGAAFALGRAYRAANDTAAARRALERALLLDPDHRRAARELAALD